MVADLVVDTKNMFQAITKNVFCSSVSGIWGGGGDEGTTVDEVAGGLWRADDDALLL
jgi:hypothetical protein